MRVTVFTLNLICGIAASAGVALSNSSSTETSTQAYYSFPTETSASSVVDSQSPVLSPILYTDGTASESSSSTSIGLSSSATETFTFAPPTITPAPDFSCDQCRLFGGSVQIFKWVEEGKQMRPGRFSSIRIITRCMCLFPRGYFEIGVRID